MVRSTFDFFVKTNILMGTDFRMPATSYLATASGLNLPLLSIYLAMNIDFVFKPLKEGLKLSSYRGFMITDDLGNNLGQV